MSTDKQIAEIAVKGCTRNPQAHTAEECAACEFKNGMCNSYKLSKLMYDEGCRKVYDLVMNIFNDIAEVLKLIDQQNEKIGSEYGDLLLTDVGCGIGEIREKYKQLLGENT